MERKGDALFNRQFNLSLIIVILLYHLGSSQNLNYDRGRVKTSGCVGGWGVIHYCKLRLRIIE